MSARQLIVLGLALVAAIGALLLIRGMGNRPAPQEQAQTIAGQEVVVAARDLPQGAALQASDYTTRLFPQASVSPQFIQAGARDLTGAVTRRAFVAGEPITTGSVIQPEGQGFLAAQLPPGYRAVAVEIEAQTAAGGFVHPNDRVDVIVTTRTQVRDGRGGEDVRSDIILEDVRVLAIDDNVQPQTSGDEPEQLKAEVAVLELSAQDARTLAMADELGSISLVLRGVEAEPPGMRAPSAARGGAAMSQRSGAVRVHAFGTVTEGGR